MIDSAVEALLGAGNVLSHADCLVSRAASIPASLIFRSLPRR